MRTTRALSLSEAGRAYYERIKALIEDFDALDASVRNASGAPSGKLRITAPITFGTTQLAPVLISFAKSCPDIQLDLSFSDRLVNLVDEGFDAAIPIGQPVDSRPHRTKALFCKNCACCCALLSRCSRNADPSDGADQRRNGRGGREGEAT